MKVAVNKNLVQCVRYLPSVDVSDLWDSNPIMSEPKVEMSIVDGYKQGAVINKPFRTDAEADEYYKELVFKLGLTEI